MIKQKINVIIRKDVEDLLDEALLVKVYSDILYEVIIEEDFKKPSLG